MIVTSLLLLPVPLRSIEPEHINAWALSCNLSLNSSKSAEIDVLIARPWSNIVLPPPLLKKTLLECTLYMFRKSS